MGYDQLKLENQLCFPLYAVSRLITKEYKPHLDKLGITYPQYLVLMILWEKDGISVNEITKKLILNTNTITPLLKRMEKQGIIKRHRSVNDERKVIINLTKEGKLLREEAVVVPEKLAAKLISGSFDIEEIIKLKDKLNTIIQLLSDKDAAE